MILSLLLQVSLAIPVAPVPPDTLRIGVVGDNQQQPAVFGQLCRNLAAEHVTHFVGLGDHVQNHGQPGEWLTLWQQPLAPIANLPRYGCIGNHDDIQGYTANVWSIPQVPVASIYGPAIACYGAVTVGQVRWVFLDTNEAPSIRLSLAATGAQRAWLAGEFASRAWRDARWRVAAWHHPWQTEFWDGGCYYPPDQDRRWIMDACAVAGAHLILNGHAHAYQRGVYNGTAWIVSGGGGGWLDTAHCADLPEITVATAQHHCLVIDATPEALTVRALDQQRQEIDRAVIR